MHMGGLTLKRPWTGVLLSLIQTIVRVVFLFVVFECFRWSLVVEEECRVLPVHGPFAPIHSAIDFRADDSVGCVRSAI